MNKDVENKIRPSKRYQDYVIKDGDFIGEFDAMYQNSSEVPWHQDKTANALFCDIDLTILGSFYQINKWRRILDVGCGLGYLTARLQSNFTESDVTGFDISKTAISQAQVLHPDIKFDVVDLRKPDLHVFETYDLIFIKDLLWYVLPELNTVVDNLKALLGKKGCVYISQSVPGLPEFYGKDIFPDPMSIINYFYQSFETQYASSTQEINMARINGVYDMDYYARFLGANI